MHNEICVMTSMSNALGITRRDGKKKKKKKFFFEHSPHEAPCTKYYGRNIYNVSGIRKFNNKSFQSLSGFIFFCELQVTNKLYKNRSMQKF